MNIKTMALTLALLFVPPAFAESAGRAIGVAVALALTSIANDLLLSGGKPLATDGAGVGAVALPSSIQLTWDQLPAWMLMDKAFEEVVLQAHANDIKGLTHIPNDYDMEWLAGYLEGVLPSILPNTLMFAQGGDAKKTRIRLAQVINNFVTKLESIFWGEER